MSTLTYSAPTLEKGAIGATTGRAGFWRRVFDRLVEAQQRRADREIARYIASRGGLLTDDMERQIMQRLSGDARR